MKLPLQGGIPGLCRGCTKTTLWEIKNTSGLWTGCNNIYLYAHCTLSLARARAKDPGDKNCAYKQSDHNIIAKRLVSIWDKKQPCANK